MGWSRGGSTLHPKEVVTSNSFVTQRPHTRGLIYPSPLRSPIAAKVPSKPRFKKHKKIY